MIYPVNNVICAASDSTPIAPEVYEPDEFLPNSDAGIFYQKSTDIPKPDEPGSNPRGVFVFYFIYMLSCWCL